MAASLSGDILQLQNEIDARVKFISEYETLSESHMVDFLSCHHWESLIHPSVREHLLQFTEPELYSVKTVFEHDKRVSFDEIVPPNDKYAVTNLTQYLKDSKDGRIENSKVLSDKSDFDEYRDVDDTPLSSLQEGITSKEYMCTKKSHEVDMMSKFVASICRKLSVRNILDMGSGKGYLGTFMSLKYKLNVVGVDCSESNSTNALLRSKKFMKYWNGLLRNQTSDEFCDEDMKYTPVTAYINPESNLDFPFENSDSDTSTQSIVLTGLHCCGDLSTTALRTFVKRTEIKGTVILGCCYHLLSSTNDSDEGQGFPLSDYLLQKKFAMRRNTRMLGLKSMERIESSDVQKTEEKSTRSLFFRAVLSVILQQEFGLDSSSKNNRVGKEYAKSKSFSDYVRRCMKKLKVPECDAQSLTDERIMTYFEEFESKKKSLIAFNMLREAFGPVVEALILLDRLLFLREQCQSHNINSYLVRLFDPEISPRCYAIVGVKS